MAAGVPSAFCAWMPISTPATSTTPATRASVSLDVWRRGRAAHVAPTATTDDRLVRYAVTLAFDEPPSRLMLGQTASATVTTGAARDAVYVPAAAVRSRADGASVVTVRSGGKDTARVVRTGIRGDQYVEVTSGVGEHDQVVMAATGTGEFPDGAWPNG
ncbi:efflux RND transporter periplasmic adaptor subunit [Nonomuraea sp. LPB2021202275-12-8]|uniref:efflux RND transporter periplasmic adaptor subunit n=1 Tax=Nonomuraea sp. LPB2021202275-12-8 TaxID=3120159 RepID=UPI00300CACCD